MPDETPQPEAAQPVEAKPATRAARPRAPRRFPARRGPPRRTTVPRRPAAAPKREKNLPPLKLFGRWDSVAEINDPGLKNYINLEPRLLPRSAGVHRNQFHKSKMHVVERLALHLLIPGHQGKKHRLTSGPLSGNFHNVMKAIEDALEIIEKKENKNPIEVLVRAIENGALREEIISYQLGSIMAREAVITAPQRRVDRTLRALAQGAYHASFNKKANIAQALANEIMAAAKGSDQSFAVRERERLEREAASAR